MSETRAFLALAAVLALCVPPAAAQECRELTRSFVFCPGAGPWAGAIWMQGQRGVRVEQGSYIFEFVEPRGSAADFATSEAALDAILRSMPPGPGGAPQATLLRDGFDTATTQVARAVFRLEAASGPALFAVMYARADGPAEGPIVRLLLTAHPEVPMPAFDRATRDLAGLVRPAGGG